MDDESFIEKCRGIASPEKIAQFLAEQWPGVADLRDIPPPVRVGFFNQLANWTPSAVRAKAKLIGRRQGETRAELERITRQNNATDRMLDDLWD
jgi:hypothetical protein